MLRKAVSWFFLASMALTGCVAQPEVEAPARDESAEKVVPRPPIEDLFSAAELEANVNCERLGAVVFEEDLEGLLGYVERLEAANSIPVAAELLGDLSSYRPSAELHELLDSYEKRSLDVTRIGFSNVRRSSEDDWSQVPFATIQYYEPKYLQFSLQYCELSERHEEIILAYNRGITEVIGLFNEFGDEVEAYEKQKNSEAAAKAIAKQCSEPLKISETGGIVGICGTTSVRVIQADLLTGSCAFLGTYDDKYGNSRTGYFEFCPKFPAGSFIEGRTYTVTVKATGTISYETKGGWTESSIKFSVQGN